jgi:hypothetical protein
MGGISTHDMTDTLKNVPSVCAWRIGLVVKVGADLLRVTDMMCVTGAVANTLHVGDSTDGPVYRWFVNQDGRTWEVTMIPEPSTRVGGATRKRPVRVVATTDPPNFLDRSLTVKKCRCEGGDDIDMYYQDERDTTT